MARARLGRARLSLTVFVLGLNLLVRLLARRGSK